jgi:hypothetical protein
VSRLDEAQVAVPDSVRNPRHIRSAEHAEDDLETAAPHEFRERLETFHESK